MALSDLVRQQVAAAAFSLPDVTARRMFGADTYLVQGKMFTFLMKESLGIKVAPPQREGLLAAGHARPFTMTDGRVFGDWLELPLATADARQRALELLPNAHDHVRGLPAPKPSGRRLGGRSRPS